MRRTSGPGARRALAAGLAVAVLASLSGPAAAEDEWVVRESGQSVADTVERLKEAITRSGSVVLATVDHRAAAEAAGYEMPPSTVVTFGNPKLGTPLMQADPRAAIDLPQRILVWEEDGSTRLGYVAPAVLAERYRLDPASGELATMTDGLAALVEAAVSRAETRP